MQLDNYCCCGLQLCAHFPVKTAACALDRRLVPVLTGLLDLVVRQVRLLSPSLRTSSKVHLYLTNTVVLTFASGV